jgi:hypothetical protein
VSVKLRTQKLGKVRGNPTPIDDIVMDGTTILGFSFQPPHFMCHRIHWHYYKDTIPPAVRHEAMELIRARNRKSGI